MPPTRMMMVWLVSMPTEFSAATLAETLKGFTVAPSTPAVEPSRMVEAEVRESKPAATMVEVTRA